MLKQVVFPNEKEGWQLAQIKPAKLNHTHLFISCQHSPLLEIFYWTLFHKIKQNNSWKKIKNALIKCKVHFLLQMYHSKWVQGIM